MTIWKGNPVSRGIAIGKVFRYVPYEPTVHDTYIPEENREREYQRFLAAIQETQAELNDIADSLTAEGNKDKAEIFLAHGEILEDEEFMEMAKELLCEEGRSSEQAVSEVFLQFADMLESTEDPLIAARAADYRDVRRRVLRILNGEEENSLSHLSEPVIVVSHDLLPSDTATMDRRHVLGIVTEIGGSASHSAIIARSYQIPALLGVTDILQELSDGAECIVDACEGIFYSQPDAALIGDYREKRLAFLKERSQIEKFAEKPAVLADGHPVDIGLNIGSDEENDYFPRCSFVGLFRTEFLFMHADRMPGEEEQYKAYCNIIRQAKGRVVTLRTLDIGGDKNLSYLPMPQEENPFLGRRALRLCLDQKELFHTQLLAVLRASAEGPLQIMFPMVGTMDDVLAAKKAVEKAKEELRQRGTPFNENIPLGIMIEIPAIIEILDMVMEEIDFGSVGTNDLTQYGHAVDRMNPMVASYYQSKSPAMMRMLHRIFSSFLAAGKPCSICGELAGEALVSPVLVGLGAKKLSMSGSNIPEVKEMLSHFTKEDCRRIAETVCLLPTEEDIIRFLKGLTK